MSHLRRVFANICLIEDAMSRRSDPGLSTTHMGLMFLDESVYWFLAEMEKDDMAKVSTTMHGLHFWGAIAVLTTCPPGGVVRDGHTLDSSSVKHMALEAQRILVSAYDGEGFLIWYRGGWEGQ